LFREYVAKKNKKTAHLFYLLKIKKDGSLAAVVLYEIASPASVGSQ
jgi:hypothetical protein